MPYGRPYRGLQELDYPFHGHAHIVTHVQRSTRSGVAKPKTLKRSLQDRRYRPLAVGGEWRQVREHRWLRRRARRELGTQLSIPAKPNTSARSFPLVVEIRFFLPGVLDDQAEQRQSFLLLVDDFAGQDVELGLQASGTAVNVQHVREQHEIHRADRTTVIDAHIE